MSANQLIKNILAILIVIIAGYLLPWWMLSAITLIIGYNSKKEKYAVANGFIIGFLSWFIILIYYFYNGGNIIFTKMSMLLDMNNPIILIIFTATLSGILGLVSGWTGWQLNNKEYND